MEDKDKLYEQGATLEALKFLLYLVLLREDQDQAKAFLTPKFYPCLEEESPKNVVEPLLQVSKGCQISQRCMKVRDPEKRRCASCPSQHVIYKGNP